MEWSREQQDALASVKSWLDRGGEGVYRLFGYAGTGKTTIAKEFASGLSGTTVFGAFTGKAAYVLRQKGCNGASTIHQMIYKPAEKNKERLEQLRKELDQLTAHLADEGLTAEAIAVDLDVVKLRGELEAEVSKHRRPSFALNRDSNIKQAALIVIDECSMVDQRIGEDLLSFNRPVLVLGDPAQLPPVRGSGYFTDHKPDFLLEEIHRQAKDNPILRLAHMVRSGQSLQVGEYGNSKVITKDKVDRDEVLNYDQVLVGLNKTRRGTNDRIRELLDRPRGTPVTGDRLVCLRNNHEVGLLNGGIHHVNAAIQIDSDTYDLDLRADDSDSTLQVTAHSQYFGGCEPPFWSIKDHECFDFGFSLTAHKAQGSQWPSVYLFDESWAFRQDAKKWLYTSLTRASEKITVVL